MLYVYIYIYIFIYTYTDSWRGEELVKTRIFPTSFDLAAVHDGCF